jgi:cytochrome c553
MKNKLLTGALMVAVGGCFAGSSLAAGDATAGMWKAVTCLGCHGVPSYSNAYPMYKVPKLGGQHAQYLVSALQAYRSGQRNHPTMGAQASNLSDEDMQDIAAYFESEK